MTNLLTSSLQDFFTCTGPTQHAAEPMDVAETTGASDAVVPASCLL